MEPGGHADDRRTRSDRREGSAQEGRRSAKRRTSPLGYVLRSLGAVVVLFGVILYAVRVTRPVYATRGTLGDELRKHAPEVAKIIAPGDSALERFVTTAQFQEEKQNFYEDVMRLKQVDSARADSIAHFAVREAYRRGISPAIIFGVMLTENSRFISNAKSNVGAVGLMQVYPKIWLTKEMTRLFGHDLATDSTNVKYGVFILKQYFNPKDKKGQVRDRDWATALLRYNGCVRGTNTPRCHTYPSKVKGFIENQGTSICDGRGFYECIGKPFIEGLMGGRTKDTAATVQQAAQPVAAPVTPGPSGSAAPAVGSPPPVVVTPAVVTRPAEAVKAVPAEAKPRATTSRSTSSKTRVTPKATKRAKAKRSSAGRTVPEIPPPPKPITVKIP